MTPRIVKIRWIFTKVYGIRSENHVYANYYEQDPPYEYLHDISIDPYQLANYATNQDYAEILEELKEKSDSFTIPAN